jgi:hypothetical protein
LAPILHVVVGTDAHRADILLGADHMFQGTDELDRQSAVRDQDHAYHEDILRVVSSRPPRRTAGGFLA